jgi:hypothetical protein
MSKHASPLYVAMQLPGKIPQPEIGSPQSPKQDRKIWKAALQKYYNKLANSGYKGHAINKDL